MLKVEEVEISIQNTTLLENLNFSLKKKEAIALLGPNGSGKSSLLKSLAGHPDFCVKGKIILNNVNITSISPEIRFYKGLFLSFQEPVVFNYISIISILSEALQAKNKYYNQNFNVTNFLQEFNKYRALLNLPEDIKTNPYNLGLSGGEKKKLELLQMLILQPSICLLDEIDTGLDLDAKELIGRIIKKYPGTKIIISHDLSFLRQIVPDRIFLIENKTITIHEPSILNKLEKSGFLNDNK